MHIATADSRLRLQLLDEVLQLRVHLGDLFIDSALAVTDELNPFDLPQESFCLLKHHFVVQVLAEVRLNAV